LKKGREQGAGSREKKYKKHRRKCCKGEMTQGKKTKK
jgi:hypothetical protein